MILMMTIGGDDVANKKTFVVAGFPGIGKSFASNHIYPNTSSNRSMTNGLNILDLDSSHFSKVVDSSGNVVVNGNFINDYYITLSDYIRTREYDIIFISTHSDVIKYLKPDVIVYPEINGKDNYLKRFEDRNDNQQFIEFISENWYHFIEDIESCECEWLYELPSSDYIDYHLFNIYRIARLGE